MKRKCKTGEIIPRDYGILVCDDKRGEKLFLSPIKYAIAQQILEEKKETLKRLENFARKRGFNEKEVKIEFEEAVKKKEGLKTMLDVGGKDAIFDVKKYGNLYFARIQSKSYEEGVFYEVQIEGVKNNRNKNSFNYIQSRCECSESFWYDTKRRNVICSHVAVLHKALSVDNMKRLSLDKNLTGLSPIQRKNVPPMPFKLKNDLIAQILWDFYVEEKKQFEINKQVLEIPYVYSLSLRNLLFNLDLDENTMLFYSVIREREKEIIPKNETERREFASSKKLVGRLERILRERDFIFEGYGVEFRGTKYEIIGKRFKNNNRIYTIVSSSQFPPLIVRKFLGEKDIALYKSSDLNYENPFLRTEEYESVDDYTRRRCLTKIIIPGESSTSSVFVPEIIKKKYEYFKNNCF